MASEQALGRRLVAGEGQPARLVDPNAKHDGAVAVDSGQRLQKGAGGIAVLIAVYVSVLLTNMHLRVITPLESSLNASQIGAKATSKFSRIRETAIYAQQIRWSSSRPSPVLEVLK